ncbi:MAG: AAA family ATPase [Caldilineaceae bacterium]|nr:AAA family ATPase [Caldilineaceae bacterium]
MDLFDQAHQQRLQQGAPLAARMRPRVLDEYIGQEHIVGPGRLLRRAIQADQLGSLIFYGPPGTGKTTLAQVIANTTSAHFIALNAVLSGVKEIREAIAEAQDRAKLHAQRTILFVDEVHRFNKAQQDALLPWVENGTVIFIGATTENPYFEVNKALVSRSRIFQLKPLTAADLRAIVHQALHDPERGYGRRTVILDEDALEHMVDIANGDARGVLNALELAVETTPPGDDGAIHVTLAVAEESIQQRAVLYDKEGDYHFDTISAFIKSLRGSDPDAAMYWMAKMVYAGEAPRFIFRRMLIFAGEDVGLADPNAIQVVTACAAAFEQVGMPEGRFHLALAALYLATAKKSNTAFAFFDALDTVSKEADSGIPNHLRDANRDSEGFGHGEGYLYPHAFRDHWVAQQYLPTSLQGKVFYQPSDQGYEAGIRTEVARRREAQLAAMLAVEDRPGDAEILTFSAPDSMRDRWLQRTISGLGERLGDLRDRVLDNAHLARHSLVLDLKTGSGLITWEALRRVPEGGVYTLARSVRDAEALNQLAAQLPETERPLVLQGDLAALPELLAAQEGPRHFDAVVGHNVLVDVAEKGAAVELIAATVAPGGTVSLAERIPRHTQRLYKLLALDGSNAGLGDELTARLIAAEEAIYTRSDDPLVSWDADDLAALWETTGLRMELTTETEIAEVRVSAGLLARWFSDTPIDGRPSYAQHLAVLLTPTEIEQVRALFQRQLLNQTVAWHSRTVYVVARAGGNG